MPARIRGIPIPKFFDDSGNVLAGGKVYFYESGTTTDKTVWKDSGKATAHANPVVLDSSGRPSSPIFAEGLYTVKVDDADDTELYTVDDWGVEDPSGTDLSTITLSAGTGLSGGGTIDQDRTFSVDFATQTQQETGTATDVAINPAVQHYHDSAAKAWAAWNSAGTVNDSYNVSSVDDDGTGNFGVNFSTSFSSANYAAGGGYSDTSGDTADGFLGIDTVGTGSIEVQCINHDGSNNDPDGNAFVVCLGDL